MDWIWESESGCGLDLRVWKWILMLFTAFGSPHVHFDCYLQGFVNPCKAPEANPDGRELGSPELALSWLDPSGG